MADTIISDGQGNMKILKGNEWVDYTGPPPGMSRGSKQSPQAQAFLNTLSQQAADAGETRRVYDRAREDVHSLKPGPYRGALMQAATPEDNGGILDRLGAVVIGAPLRAIGAITPKETEAYQRLRGLQSQQVLQAQLAQKGPQTESDAARLMLTEISPSKLSSVNEDIINKGVAKTERARAKAAFYTKWANKYGLNATNPQGQSADEIWSNAADYITNRIIHGAPRHSESGNSTIRVLSRTKVR